MAGEFGPDGTQALPPLPLHTDALSGLAGWAIIDPASWSDAFADVPDTVVPPLVAPLPVNHDRVRAAARREVARDRTRRASQPAVLPPAAGLARKSSAPNFGLPASRGLPPAPDAIQQGPRRNAAAGFIGCAVVLVLVFIVLAVVVVALGSQQ